MTQAIRDPNLDLLARIVALEKSVEAIRRLPSGMTSLGIGPLAPPTKAGQPLDGDYQITPPVGTLVWDTAGQVLWARQSAGLWVGPGGGALDYAEVAADQTGITAETDLTGLTVTVTVGTGRRIKLTAQGKLTRTVVDGQNVLAIKEGSTFLNYAMDFPSTSTPNTRICIAVTTPTAGSHTYKVTAWRNTGTGTLGLNADSNNPAFLLVEDIGAA